MKIVITAGKTGGHVYPAISIIKALQKDNKNKLFFIGTNSIEKPLIEELNIPFFTINMHGFNRKNMIKNIKLSVEILITSYQIRKLYKKIKPDVIIGFGGYISYVPILIGRRMKIKTIIHEQNVDFGLANKHLLNKTDKIFVSFEETKNLYPNIENIIFTGNPRGYELKQFYHKNKEQKKHILIYGGSLGAKTINDCFLNEVNRYKNASFYTYLITGKRYYEDTISIPKSNNYKIMDYANQLSDIINKCDLIVCRAGATSISELINIKMPAILIPSPNVTNNHQEANAKILEKNGCVKILYENELTSEHLFNTIESILDNNVLYYEMIEGFNKFKRINAIEAFVKEIMNRRVE